jgi:hypothetical protein
LRDVWQNHRHNILFSNTQIVKHIGGLINQANQILIGEEYLVRKIFTLQEKAQGDLVGINALALQQGFVGALRQPVFSQGLPFNSLDVGH